jgi:hypothetical protein
MRIFNCAPVPTLQGYLFPIEKALLWPRRAAKFGFNSTDLFLLIRYRAVRPAGAEGRCRVVCTENPIGVDDAPEAFPWDSAPGYTIRDRDRIYGAVVTRRLRAMGIRDKPIAPASPWQNDFAGRLIGSIRRECVDHVIVLGEAHLRRILKSYARYYNPAS